MASPTLWQLELGDNGEVPKFPNDEGGVLRITCGDTVTFTLPAGSTPTLVDTPALLVRNELGDSVKVTGQAQGNIGDWHANWNPEQPGPYELAVEYRTTEDVKMGPACGIVVDPVLRINGNFLPARSVVQLTVLSRCIGKIEQWPDALSTQAKLGYNMVHFTPIQPPGESGSCYALDDQNAIDDTLMAKPAAAQADRLKVVAKCVSQLEAEHGMLSAMDIVLNHTAGDSTWLLDHPECAYNVSNSPHLLAAALLDERLAWYSNELVKGRFGGPRIDNQGDVDRVMHGIQEHVLGPLHLNEFFRVDWENSLTSWDSVTDDKIKFEGDNYDAFKNAALPSVGAARSGAFVLADASKRFCRDRGTLQRFLSLLQNDLLAMTEPLQWDILGSLRGTITHERLQQRKGPVGEGHLMLVPCYFRKLSLSQAAQKRLGKDTETVAHNGWVMDWPATEDFAAPSWRMVYLRRHLCAWGDCAKLRYGTSPTDAPFLWDHMTRYAVSMAKIFHAIRLDNAHSTPLHVSQYVLAQVRKANPHCWIFAELFTGDFSTDLLYQRKLGINALIREAMQCDSPDNIAGMLEGSLWGAHPVGAISVVPTLDHLALPAPCTRSADDMPTRSLSFAFINTQVLPLRPRLCPALLFDCTHDNQTPSEKRHPRDALPNAALVAASCASIGSVRGYDELLPTNPSVVFERRAYQTVEGVDLIELGWPELPSQGTSEAAEQELEIVWRRGASKTVVARGTWDGWRTDLALTKQQTGEWSARLKVPAHAPPMQYKFVVDGTWTIDDAQPTARCPEGHLNNVLATGLNGGSPMQIQGPDVVQGMNHAPGILTAKQILNKLHAKLGREGFVEIGVHRLADDVVGVQRRAPDSGRSTWFLTRSAFWRHRLGDHLGCPAALEVTGCIAHIHLAATLFIDDKHERRFSEDDAELRGLDSYMHLYSRLDEIAHVHRDGDKTWLHLHHFPPGSVLVFSTCPVEEAWRHDEVMKRLTLEEIERPLNGLSCAELNYLLFSCETEELDRSGGTRGSYVIPDHGPLVYCGLMGVCAVLDQHRATLTEAALLQSPVVRNVREGDWLFTYLTSRLDDMPALSDLQDWLDALKGIIAGFSRCFVPFYFDLVVSTLCASACNVLLRNTGTFLERFGNAGASPLTRDLALATAQFYGATKSAPLHWDRAAAEGWRAWPSLSAGLPHFSAGFMRNWGRDTFISLRGCLLETRRFQEARATLLVYASVVRHGLVPNLLDAANRPRYNARDATWFFLQAVQDYVRESDEGVGFLSSAVALKWPVREWDEELADLEPRNVADLVHLILSAHAKGIEFREWGAGKGIDEHMTDEGFNIRVRFDEDTGLIAGGNVWNCGTWMDKMGSSAKAGNKGVPATPRDGAAVEIIGLLKSTLRWVAGLDKAVFPHRFVKTQSGKNLTYQDWDALLQQNFERLFWISPDERSEAIVRSIYKDTVGATQKWQDTQLRPNFCIAMAVAPELFTPMYAREALNNVSERLIGPLGMCTLDPADPEYRGDYINDDDSTDKSVAHGWNYHQGPEWVWPLGFFLEAWQKFCGTSDDGSNVLGQQSMRWLLSHRAMLKDGVWRSLPELTNASGKVCHHSCPAQAWSVATLLSAVRTIEQGRPPSDSKRRPSAKAKPVAAA